MDWFGLAAGNGCPFDPPRAEPNDYWDSVDSLTVSTLCLLKNQFYRGHSILIYDPRHVCRLDQLTPDEWASFAQDLQVAVGGLFDVYRPDHVNVESLGNEMPHLHWHLVPRYRDDPRWGGPIWTTTREELGKHESSSQERSHSLEALRIRLRAARYSVGA